MQEESQKKSTRKSRENTMKKALMVSSDDIKKILSEKFGVPESNIIKSQYSYTVVLEEEE